MTMNWLSTPLRAALLLLPALAWAQSPGAVYTSTNSASGNQVLIYNRASGGALSPAGSVSTGGLGTGGGLGNQGALAMSADEQWLFVVNAGSNDISSMEITATGLRLADRAPARGQRPVSVTVFGRTVYVLNAGSDSIAGFTYDDDGRLWPLASSVEQLSATGTAPAQIQFSRDGDYLVVTEKATNRIVLFPVDRFGRTRRGVVHQSAGQTPFGFAIGDRNQIFVSEAFGGAPNQSAVTSYRVGDRAELNRISGSVSTLQTAACWTVLHPDEPLAFVSNTASNSISSYRIGFDGSLTLAHSVAVTTGQGPIDMALAPSGRFLYVLNSAAGSIGDYTVNLDGTLTSIPGTITGLPVGTNGLAAR